MALCSQIVNFRRINLREQPCEKRSIRQSHSADAVAVPGSCGLINIRKATRIERTRLSNDPVNLIPFGQQEFGEIRTVLARHAGNQRTFLRLTAMGRLPTLASL